GHPPPLLLRADGTVRLLTGEPDLLVGLTTDLARRDHDVLLHPGDTVLLYTDGLVETRAGDIEADLQDLVARVAVIGDGHGPQVLVDRLVDGLAELSDDVALLAVRVC
ncbi:MAG: rsbP 1, partial [Frankiales bacterium]|nr:rsbP 1 [Frankiales bacterium]